MAMKKTLIVSLAALALVLAGCGNQAEKQTQATSSDKVSTSHKKQAQTKKASSTTSTSSSSASSQSSSEESSQAQSSTAASNGPDYSGQVRISATQNLQRLGQFNYLLKYNLGKEIVIPNNPGYNDESKKLNVWYEGDGNNYSIHYSQAASGQDFNANSLRDVTDYAVFTKKTYGSASEAQAEINYQTAAMTQGLPKVNLGYGIIGTIDSGAGQKYLHWNEGRWSLGVHAVAVNDEDPVPTARKVVELLERYYLPTPDKYGAGSFSVASSSGQQAPTLKWQAGNSVYSLEAKDLTVLVRMASTVK